MWITVTVLIVGGGLVAWIGWFGMSDRLTRNAWAGIRTKTTMRSDEAWQAAHRSAGKWIIWGGVVMVVTGIVMGVVDGDDSTAATVALVGMVAVFGLVGVGGWLGIRAASRVE